mgnify:CR=1 FL=1
MCIRDRPVIALLLSVIALGGIWGDSAGKDEETKKVEALVQQLGDEDFSKREAASKELDTLGAVSYTHLTLPTIYAV